MRKIALFIALLITISINADNLLHFSGSEASIIGIYIEDLRTGKIVASQNENKAMTPASVTKSITSAAAMLLLEKDFQFKTPIYAIGDTIVYDGNLNCDIVIDACGDPTIDSEHFPNKKGIIDRIVSSLKSKGVTKLNGDIIINSANVKLDNVSSTWMIEDVAWDYGAVLNAFNYNDNSFKICIPSATETISVQKKIPNLIIDNQLVIGKENNVSLTRSSLSNNLVLSGTIKPSISNYEIGCSMPNPSAVFNSDLKTQLALSGISIFKKNTEKKDTMLIYCHKSPKRDEILRSLMVRSDNLFAEGMIQAINPMGNAIDSVISKFEQIGINCKTISLHDGSGLSRVDRLTPHFIAKVFQYMYNSNLISDYIALFPKSGCDGTLKNFLSNTRLKGLFALKTGSMDGVQCYGGYKLNQKGEPTHIVVIMVNNFFCKRKVLRKDIERLLLQIF